MRDIIYLTYEYKKYTDIQVRYYRNAGRCDVYWSGGERINFEFANGDSIEEAIDQIEIKLNKRDKKTSLSL